MDNFADHPVSLAEARAKRERDGSKWTPRDALIAALRDLDAGVIKPVELAVIFRERTEEERIDRYPGYYAVDSFSSGAGLLAVHLADYTAKCRTCG